MGREWQRTACQAAGGSGTNNPKLLVIIVVSRYNSQYKLPTLGLSLVLLVPRTKGKAGEEGEVGGCGRRGRIDWQIWRVCR